MCPMKSKYANSDRYVEPATGVLFNKLGLRDEDTLAAAEAQIVAWRTIELRQSPIPGCYDLEHLQAVHRHLFQDVYEWAGELRDINISKGSSFFAAFNHLEVSAEAIFRRLADERHLQGLDPATFSARAADYLGEINALHPFREGNGRAQREFMNHVAAESGFVIQWENAKPSAIEATAIQSFHGRLDGLTMLIRANLVPRGPNGI